MDHIIDHKTLGNMFQEIIVEFSEMGPTELAVLCGASWKYTEAEYMIQKVLRRRCVCHEIVFNKKLQGEYFDNMEVYKDPPVLIYTDLDGVMINSRDNARRMEGKVAIVWSAKELVKADTYSLTDKRAIGTFTDTERFYWDITAELYKRSGGRMDEVDTLVRGDGAAFIRGFRMHPRADVVKAVIASWSS